MNNKPVILAAFANDQGRFLESLQQESDAISDANMRIHVNTQTR